MSEVAAVACGRCRASGAKELCAWCPAKLCVECWEKCGCCGKHPELCVCTSDAEVSPLTDDTAAERRGDVETTCACRHYALSKAVRWVAMLGEAHTVKRCGRFNAMRAKKDEVEVWWASGTNPFGWSVG